MPETIAPCPTRSLATSGRVAELPRLWRSPYSDFGSECDELHEETVTANAVYTDEVLAGIAQSGVNAIWVHGQLHHLVPCDVFPEFGEQSEIHLANLRELIARASRHDLRVYIYMQPPRGFDERDAFWLAHPEVIGSPTPWQTVQGEHATYRALCTSTDAVKTHLLQAPARLVRELPGLGGLILITASEYPSHCYGRGDMQCPRCAQRSGMEVINEVIQLVHDSVRSVSNSTDIIAWNWSWSYVEPDPSPTILRNLPDDAILMADFERGDTREILGKTRPIDEYSLSFIGPSQRFMNCYRSAQERGMPIIAKLQFGTTHELATVPNIPVTGNLYEKARRLRELGISGFMGCWNFGNMLTANSAAFNEFMNAETLAPRTEALEAFATSYFPGCEPAPVLRSWDTFAAAMESYPFSIPFIYMGPMNYSLAYPLKPAPLDDSEAGRSWIDDARGDHLEACFEPYTLEEIITGMGQLATTWLEGVKLLEEGLRHCTDQHSRQELATSWVCGRIWRSTWNTFRVYHLRLRWEKALMGQYLEIIRDELENLEAVLPYVEADNRFGFHSEAFAHLFDAPRIRQKIADSARQLAAR